MTARQAASMDSFFMPSNQKPVVSKTDRAAEMARVRAVYDGEMTEVTKHGKIVCERTAGLITSLSGVTLSNGKFADTVKRGLLETNQWRVKGDDGRWVYGTLEFSKKNVNFIPDLTPQPVHSFPATSLPFFLLKSSNACELVKDDHVAIYLYGALTSCSWKMAGSGRKWSCNWIQAAQTVAQMRGLNEPYTEALTDYESERQGCEEAELIVDIFNGLGWEIDFYPDLAETHKRAERLVAEHELKEPGETPDWYAQYITALRPDNDLVSRANIAAFTGRLPFKQWYSFWQLYNLDHQG
jgi:hypothetical protein